MKKKTTLRKTTLRKTTLRKTNVKKHIGMQYKRFRKHSFRKHSFRKQTNLTHKISRGGVLFPFKSTKSRLSREDGQEKAAAATIV
jgi:hypothetical protein